MRMTIPGPLSTAEPAPGPSAALPGCGAGAGGRDKAYHGGTEERWEEGRQKRRDPYYWRNKAAPLGHTDTLCSEPPTDTAAGVCFPVGTLQRDGARVPENDTPASTTGGRPGEAAHTPRGRPEARAGRKPIESLMEPRPTLTPGQSRNPPTA